MNKEFKLIGVVVYDNANKFCWKTDKKTCISIVGTATSESRKYGDNFYLIYPSDLYSTQSICDIKIKMFSSEEDYKLSDSSYPKSTNCIEFNAIPTVDAENNFIWLVDYDSYNKLVNTSTIKPKIFESSLDESVNIQYYKYIIYPNDIIPCGVCCITWISKLDASANEILKQNFFSKKNQEIFFAQLDRLFPNYIIEMLGYLYGNEKIQKEVSNYRRPEEFVEYLEDSLKGKDLSNIKFEDFCKSVAIKEMSLF